MQCPQCKNEVLITEANYGALYTCPVCMAVYFINFEGQAEYDDTPAPPVIENFENVMALPEVAAEVLDSTFMQAAREITEYGNQEEIISQISYDLHVKGLDTKEVKLAFKEAIDDSKFSWMTDDIMNQIKNGESHLKNLNPIQAFVLATRIQFLDLEIEWKQNVAF